MRLRGNDDTVRSGKGVDHLQVQMRAAINQNVFITVFKPLHNSGQHFFRCYAIVIIREHGAGVLHTDEPRQDTGQLLIRRNEVQVVDVR